MNDLSKKETSTMREIVNQKGNSLAGLERADLGGSQGTTLHTQIARRLRNVFPTPDGQNDAFDALLQQISDRHS